MQTLSSDLQTFSGLGGTIDAAPACLWPEKRLDSGRLAGPWRRDGTKSRGLVGAIARGANGRVKEDGTDVPCVGAPKPCRRERHRRPACWRVEAVPQGSGSAAERRPERIGASSGA